MTETTVAVLGLGPMGSAIARTLSSKGHRVRALNRTRKTLPEFGLDHTAVELLDSPQETLCAADLVVVCVRDHDASRKVLGQLAPHIGGRVDVNVSTGTPSHAIASAAHAAELGVRYVTGAVMVPTAFVGTEHCVVLYAGAMADLAPLEPLFDAFGGVSDIVGNDHAVPPALDLAMHDIYFAGMHSHLHATALAESRGIEPARFLPYAAGIVDTLGGSLAGLTESIQRRSYDGGEAQLDMCLSFLELIVAFSRDAGIAPGLGESVRAASAHARENWPATAGWDVVAENFIPVSPG